MSIRMNGIEATRQILAENLDIRVLTRHWRHSRSGHCMSVFFLLTSSGYSSGMIPVVGCVPVRRFCVLVRRALGVTSFAVASGCLNVDRGSLGAGHETTTPPRIDDHDRDVATCFPGDSPPGHRPCHSPLVSNLTARIAMSRQ